MGISSTTNAPDTRAPTQPAAGAQAATKYGGFGSEDMSSFGYKPGQFNNAYDPYTKGQSVPTAPAVEESKKKDEEKRSKKKKKEESSDSEDSSDSSSDDSSDSDSDDSDDDDKKKKKKKKAKKAKGLEKPPVPSNKIEQPVTTEPAKPNQSSLLEMTSNTQSQPVSQGAFSFMQQAQTAQQPVIQQQQQ